LVHLIADPLRDTGIDRFVVDGSGDLRHRGPDPVMVRLEYPTLAGRVIGAVPLRLGQRAAPTFSTAVPDSPGPTWWPPGPSPTMPPLPRPTGSASTGQAGKLAGSSGCADGFNVALTKIR
jgi:hypothetical protein